MLHLPNNIKLIRKLAKKKQTQFVGLFRGVTVPMQKSYESGKAKPDIVYMQLLSDFSGVSQRDLLQKELRTEDVRFGRKVEEVEGDEEEKPDSVDYRAKYVQKLEENEAWLKKLVDSSFVGLLDNQEGGFAIVIQLLKRDALREAGGNQEKANEILRGILHKIAPDLSSKMRKGILDGEGR